LAEQWKLKNDDIKARAKALPAGLVGHIKAEIQRYLGLA
tara:strand:+ start:8104 stop:8220 length:117 start_codon:yes stop_codon:yes gene_type:complete